ncbi:hypothetical protein [Streptomyces sp. NPDC060002]|uniref:hypothetical protein n=1 Tax=Streptomyces sp. NPDC060002 TaxID=3347033 RepID=UPI003694CBD2
MNEFLSSWARRQYTARSTPCPVTGRTTRVSNSPFLYSVKFRGMTVSRAELNKGRGISCRISIPLFRYPLTGIPIYF